MTAAMCGAIMKIINYFNAQSKFEKSRKKWYKNQVLKRLIFAYFCHLFNQINLREKIN
jgi:phage gp16-like protein